MLLEKLFRKKQRSLRAVAASILTDQQRVEDAVQEAFLRVLRVRRSFQSDLEALNYLKKTIYHTAVDSYRLVRRESGRLSQTCDDRVDYRSAGEYSDPLALIIDDEESKDRLRLVREMRRGLDQLNSQEQEAIRIFFGERGNRTLKEICREKKVPYSTLRSRMLAGVDKLRRHLRRKELTGFTETDDEV